MNVTTYPLDFNHPEAIDDEHAKWPSLMFTIDQKTSPNGCTTVRVSGPRDDVVTWLFDYCDDDDVDLNAYVDDAHPLRTGTMHIRDTFAICTNLERHKRVAAAVEDALPKNVDTLVCTGLSGMLVTPFVAATLGLNLVVVRKEKSRDRYLVEGSLGKHWVLLDDFVFSGATTARVVDRVAFECRRRGYSTEFVGVMCYWHHDELNVRFLGAKHLYRSYSIIMLAIDEAQREWNLRIEQKRAAGLDVS